MSSSLRSADSPFGKSKAKSAQSPRIIKENELEQANEPADMVKLPNPSRGESATARRVWLAVFFIIIWVAFLIRLSYVSTLPDTLSFDEPIYDELASNLVAGRGYTLSTSAYHTTIPNRPTSFQEPIYPLLLAGIYRIVGENQFYSARAIQALLGTGALAILIALASRLWGRAAALGVGVVGAFHIPLIYFSGLLMTENLFILFLLLFLLLWTRAIARQRFRMLVLAGIVYAAACLTRSLLLFFLPAVLLGTAVCTYSQKRRLRSALGATLGVLLGVVLTIFPWTLRNYSVHDAFVPITTKGGINLYYYTYPIDDLDFNSRWDQVPIPEVEGLTEVERESLFRRAALENMKAFPQLQFRFAMAKVLDFWNPIAERGPTVVRLAYGLEFMILLVLAAIGVASLLRESRDRALGAIAILLLLYYSLAAAVFTGGGKARLAVEPILILLAGGGITFGYGKLRSILRNMQEQAVQWEASGRELSGEVVDSAQEERFPCA